MRLIHYLVVAGLCLSAAPVRAQVIGGNVIYTDDLHSDPDISVNWATLHHLADRGEINILATIADYPEASGAPGIKVLNTYYGRPNLPIYADQRTAGIDPTMLAQTTSPLGIVPMFDAGDTRANYGECVAGMRSVLANLPAGQTTQIVVTGSLGCTSNLMSSAADTISPLTGAQLIKAKVSQLVVMGGTYPSTTTAEANFQYDPALESALYSTWTTQNGFPPIWGVPFATCNATTSGPYQGAGSNAAVDPPLEVYVVSGTTGQPITGRGSWDSCALLFAARGLSYTAPVNGANVTTTYFTDSGNGMNSVNASSGVNTFSTSTASGHHYLAQSATDAVLAPIFDGYKYAGFAGMPPGQGGQGALIK